MRIGETVRPFVLGDALVAMPDFYVLPNKFSISVARDREIERRQIDSRRQRGVEITEAQAARGLTDTMLARSIRDTLAGQEPFRLFAETWVTKTTAKKDDPGLDKVYPSYPGKSTLKTIIKTAVKSIKLAQGYPDGVPDAIEAKIQALYRENELRIANAFEYPTQGDETVEEAIDAVEQARVAIIGAANIQTQGNNVRYAEFPGSTLRRDSRRSTPRASRTEPNDAEEDDFVVGSDEEEEEDEYEFLEDVEENETPRVRRREVLEIEKSGTPPANAVAATLWEQGVVVVPNVATVADLPESRLRIRRGKPQDDPTTDVDGLGLYAETVRNDPNADLAIRTYEGVPTPGAFHGDRVRSYRRLMFDELRTVVDNLAPTLGIRVTTGQNLYHEPLVGALTIHTGKGGGQSWIRDNGGASKGVVLEAWLNMGNNDEDFVYVPRTHTFQSGGDSGLRNYPYNSLRAFDNNQDVVSVQPGAMVIYFRTLVHQTFVPSARPNDQNMRLYVGAAMYAGADTVRPVQSFTDAYLNELTMVQPLVGPTVDAWRNNAEKTELISRLAVDAAATFPRTRVLNVSYDGTPYTDDERATYQRRAVGTQTPAQGSSTTSSTTPSAMDTTGMRLFAHRARGHTPIRL